MAASAGAAFLGDAVDPADQSGHSARPSALRLLYWKDSSEVDEMLYFSRALLKSRSRMNISTRFEDAFFYILEPWTLHLLEDEGRFFSLKHDFIPFLIRKQFSSREKLAELEFPEQVFAENRDIARDYSSSRLASEDSEDILRCFAYINDTESICQRVTDHKSYLALNDMFCSGEVPADHNLWRLIVQENVKGSLPEEIVVVQSAVGEGGTYGSKGAIKKSTVGKYCRFGENVRVTNSLILNSVILEDGVEVSNSIVCENCVIKRNSTVRGCMLAAQQTVPENETWNNRRVSGIGLGED